MVLAQFGGFETIKVWLPVTCNCISLKWSVSSNPDLNLNIGKLCANVEFWVVFKACFKCFGFEIFHHNPDHYFESKGCKFFGKGWYLG